jgi:NAD(P)H-hydrate epimerase
MVLDADALNIIAKNNWLNKIPPNTILTPHPGEFSRLFGKSKNRLDTIEKQQKAAIEYKVIIILKGHHTTISLPSGETYVNDTGNQGMATAGSGDVLTGIIGAFLAQGYTPKDAAIYGVYIHGLCGDLAAEENALESIIASDIIQFLPKAF